MPIEPKKPPTLNEVLTRMLDEQQRLLRREILMASLMSTLNLRVKTLEARVSALEKK